jgi:TatD DNase family protein
MLIETHAHLAAPDFKDDLDLVILRAKEAGIDKILVVGAGYGKQSAFDAIKLVEKYADLYLIVGLHPCDSIEKVEKSWLLEVASAPKVRALGETGLDYYWKKTDPEIQKYNFRLHIEVAKELNLPLVIHSREAGRDCLDILTENDAAEVGGVFHCFSENADFAKRLEQINFKVSFPGSLTFKKADALREIAKQIPIEQIMLETDCPFMAPQRVRGKRAEPAHVLDIAQTLAEVKGLSLEEVSAITTNNANILFRLL